MFSYGASSQPASAPARVRRSVGRKSTVKDGKIVVKTFNPIAGRPYPPVRSLMSTITVQMSTTIPNFLITSTTIPTYATFIPTLSLMGGTAAYTSLFDQYKIDRVEVWLEPSGLPTTFAEIASCVDLDDGNTPTSFSSVADHPGSLVAGGGTARYHAWMPHCALAAYSGAFTSYANVPAPWIDSASPGVQHFGLKVAAANSAAVSSYNLVTRFVVSFRAPGIA